LWDFSWDWADTSGKVRVGGHVSVELTNPKRTARLLCPPHSQNWLSGWQRKSSN